eukprot:14686135-Alexandrium_andersonii.AAC.1
MELRCWHANDEVVMAWASAATQLDTQDSEAMDEVVAQSSRKYLSTQLLHELLCADSAGMDVSTLFSLRSDDANYLLRMWSSKGLVRAFPVGDTERWVFDDSARDQLRAGVRLSQMSNMMVPRPIKAEDLTVFELMQSLEDRGWECKAAATVEDKRLARREPYDPEKGNRTWWVLEGQAYAKLNRKYLYLLLSSESASDGGGKVVPHFATRSVYNQLIDPSWQPARRSMLSLQNAPTY